MHPDGRIYPVSDEVSAPKGPAKAAHLENANKVTSLGLSQASLTPSLAILGFYFSPSAPAPCQDADCNAAATEGTWGPRLCLSLVLEQRRVRRLCPARLRAPRDPSPASAQIPSTLRLPSRPRRPAPPIAAHLAPQARPPVTPEWPSERGFPRLAGWSEQSPARRPCPSHRSQRTEQVRSRFRPVASIPLAHFRGQRRAAASSLGTSGHSRRRFSWKPPKGSFCGGAKTAWQKGSCPRMDGCGPVLSPELPPA